MVVAAVSRPATIPRKDTTVPDYEMPSIPDLAIWDVWLSANYLPTVTAADEMGILASLNESPCAPDELAARLDFDRRATVTTLRLLAALGFLSSNLGRYQLTDQARLYLLRDSPFYWGHMLGSRQPQHATLCDTLQGKNAFDQPEASPPELRESGRSVDNWASGQIDIDRARRVAAAMQSHSRAAAAGLARNGDFSGTKRLLDVGGGSGCFSIALAQKHPELVCTIMELPAMCEVASGYIQGGGVEDRVDTVAVDMFREEWPRNHDALFFSNVFHDWNFQTCSWLARNSYEALPFGGRIHLHEMLLNDDCNGPLTTASFSMLMLLGTQGQQFTFPEIRDLLEAAGFEGIDTKPTYGYYSLVSGRKSR
jgi:hypothetical protein